MTPFPSPERLATASFNQIPKSPPKNFGGDFLHGLIRKFLLIFSHIIHRQYDNPIIRGDHCEKEVDLHMCYFVGMSAIVFGKRLYTKSGRFQSCRITGRNSSNSDIRKWADQYAAALHNRWKNAADSGLSATDRSIRQAGGRSGNCRRKQLPYCSVLLRRSAKSLSSKRQTI